MSTRLDARALRRTIDPSAFPFETTAELPPLRKPLGQARALRALDFGLSMKSHGYNVFVLGPPGAGKRSTTMAVVEEAAAHKPVPSDWVYLFNFSGPEQPLAVSLPAGMGEELRRDMEVLVASLFNEIPKALTGEHFDKEKEALLKRTQERKTVVLRELETLANSHDFLVQRSSDGLALVYAREGAPVSQEDFEKLPEEEQEKVKGARVLLQAELHDAVERVKEVERDARREVKNLEERLALAAVGHEIESLAKKYRSLALVAEYLKAVEQDVLSNLDDFRGGGSESPMLPFLKQPTPEERTRKYQVNVFVSSKDLKSAPVVFESNPTYHNLMGRLEHHVQYGAFVTDFTLLKAGALHRANGGYLVLNARDVLSNFFAYDALKRVLKEQVIRMEEIGEQFRMISTVTLRPQPIPADVKVILLGTPWLYYVLHELDEDFAKLFKVKGDFSDDMELTEENQMSYAFLIASHCAAEDLIPFGRAAVARVVEHGLRAAEHQDRLATHFLEITDLVREAHLWAHRDGAPVVEPTHVIQAIEEKIHRNNYLEEIIGRMIEEGTVLIDTDGVSVGQANGLSVYDMGDHAFGKPSRLTAKVFLGKEGLINIEREADLAGRIHNKGVLILEGYFGSRYAQKLPISFAATLCFEQSYGGIEGDSASSVELFALLSALAEVPLRQDLAVTGSVNQMGQIQAVGGINLKIEGFYKTCKVKGLTGNQGVIIPRSNVRNLMLDEEVVEAVERGQFHIHAISTVAEGMELLTGLPFGEPDDYGEYLEGTLNAKITRRLERLSRQWKKLHAEE